MAGTNHGRCHSCRSATSLWIAQRNAYARCKRAFVKCFEVEKETKNKGKLFNCCGSKCCFWEWAGDGESSCESSLDSATSTNAATNELRPDVSGIFESNLRLSDKQEFNILVKVTSRNKNGTSEVNEKGKAHA